MPTLAASEEADLALVSSTKLPEPPECKVMLAFRAFGCDCWKGTYLPALLFHNHDLPLAPFLPDQHLVILADLANVPAFAAFQLTCRRDHEALALRTEHDALLFAPMQD